MTKTTKERIDLVRQVVKSILDKTGVLRHIADLPEDVKLFFEVTTPGGAFDVFIQQAKPLLTGLLPREQERFETILRGSWKYYAVGLLKGDPDIILDLFSLLSRYKIDMPTDCACCLWSGADKRIEANAHADAHDNCYTVEKTSLGRLFTGYMTHPDIEKHVHPRLWGLLSAHFISGARETVFFMRAIPLGSVAWDFELPVLKTICQKRGLEYKPLEQNYVDDGRYSMLRSPKKGAAHPSFTSGASSSMKDVFPALATLSRFANHQVKDHLSKSRHQRKRSKSDEFMSFDWLGDATPEERAILTESK